MVFIRPRARLPRLRLALSASNRKIPDRAISIFFLFQRFNDTTNGEVDKHRVVEQDGPSH
jgi:hypothetical protein